MENYLERITINEGLCNGKPTIRGYRITVKTILEYLAAGKAIITSWKPILFWKRQILKRAFNLQRKPWIASIIL